MENQIQSGATLLQPRLVRLLQCGRKSCGHVLIEDEREWRQDPEWEAHRTAICPKCGGDGFYTLNEKGQKVPPRDHDKYRGGIDPTTIDPSPRMGLKMTKAILRAKWHAINSLPNAAPLAPADNQTPDANGNS